MRLEKMLVKVLRRSRGRAMSVADIVGETELRGSAIERVEPTLRRLALSGTVIEVEPGRFVALAEKNLLVGRISVTRRGYGFVALPGGDVYVGSKDMHGAMHGDTVAVRLGRTRDARGRSGEVTRIVERGSDQVVGRFEKQGRAAVVVPSDRRVRAVFVVDASGFGDASANDIVVLRITRYPTGRDPGQGYVTEVLGPEGAPGVDIEIIIREHGLRVAFPGEVVKAAEAIPEEVGEPEPGREDIRDVFTVTIDPVDARDFDDAISVSRSDTGGWRLGVHIADVGHYVPWGTEIDEEARRRATSVYLVDRVLPMLPERLSNGTCSLKPGVDRFSFTVMMDLDRKGRVQDYKLFPSVMKSDRRLNYDEVDEWLSAGDGFPDEQTRRLLEDFRDAAAQIAKRRIERGGLDFETVEAKVALDENGHPTGVRLRQRTVATNMIEEAMVLANETVARHMAAAEAPMVYRIHEDPDPDALAAVAAILKEFDYPMKDVHGADPRTFQRIIAFAHGRPEKLLINSLVLRSLKRAKYVDHLATHFGLASDAYTHFTSPIRRYPDLIVHRLLRAQLTRALNAPPTSEMVAELAWLASHCSQMEREAESAEDDSVTVKLCQLMADHVGEVFEGVITNVTSFGFFVQLENTAEGLVHVQSMTDDYYQFDAERFLLYGEKRGRTHRLGERVKVRIVDVAIGDMRIEMELD